MYSYKMESFSTLRKQAYSNILKILPPKNENIQINFLIFFYISAQRIYININMHRCTDPDR